jgi:hypothetical protein
MSPTPSPRRRTPRFAASGRGPFTLVAASVVAACGGAPGADGAGGEGVAVRDSAGVRLVENGAPDRPFPDSLVEVARIGAADGLLFASLRDGLVATDGVDRIAVVDRGERQLVVLTVGAADADAAVVRIDTLGRGGGGPGEFQFPGSVRFTPGGGIAVHDYVKNARVRFAPDGTPAPEQTLAYAGGRLDGDARFAADTLTAVVTVDADSAVVRSLALTRATPTDTSVLVALEQAVLPVIAFETCPLRMMRQPALMSAGIEWTAGPAGIAAVAGPEYRIDWYVGGTRQASWRRAVASVPTSVEDVDGLFPEGLRVMAGDFDCRVPSDEVERIWGLAPVRPAIAALEIAPDGTLWVERFSLDTEAPRVDVFAADGAYRGTIAGVGLPYGFLSGGRLVYDTIDPDTDEPMLRIVRLTNAGW